MSVGVSAVPRGFLAVALERAEGIVRIDEMGFAAAAEAVRILVGAAV